MGATKPVVVDELREAASGCAAVVKPDTTVDQVNPGLRIYDRFATDRSLATLLSGYRNEVAGTRLQG